MRPHIKDVNFAVDEHIWGHRLYDEQLPHLAVLEFLNVLQSNVDRPLDVRPEDSVHYRPQHQIRLRSLLFNNPHIELIREQALPDNAKWSKWMELYQRESTDLGNLDLLPLKDAFPSFDDFARCIELLRTSAFEGGSNKRWSSKFVFPFGPDALYEDLRFNANNNASNDRRFFARTGELLYLMLSRAQNGPQLGQRLVARMYQRNAPLNQLARTLQGVAQHAADHREVGYLPYDRLPRFDRMCDDWLAILDRDMPLYDGLDHLITITGLNLLLYFLECSKAAVGETEPVEILCEVVSRHRTKVRSMSVNSFQANQALSLRAVKATIERVRTSPAWDAALASPDPNGECARLLRDQFQWPVEDKDDDVDLSQLSGNDLVRRLKDKAEARHGQHVGKIHNSWSRAVGLSSRRLSRRLRYAPSDRLLKSLVVTVVDQRLEFGEFLGELNRRYGLVFGHQEGARYVQQNLVDEEALMSNAELLESRLHSLGLVRRLSDSCAFVENPFNSRGDT